MPAKNEVEDFIHVLRSAFEHERQLQHFVKDHRGCERDTTNVLRFVVYFFIYNSLYNVDWQSSLASHKRVPHAGDKEPKRQKAFEDFLADRTSRLLKNSPVSSYII